jgi:16S rRNA (uracil1498-N3)-methyltransferase
MGNPYFYFANLAAMPDVFALNENSSRHIVQVLRMQPGEDLRLTDGRGLSVLAKIREANKKKCVVGITEKKLKEQPERRIQIALALLKNTSRFEWFLEKSTELGISEIIPLITARTEKQNFRMDRLTGIVESALIQSQQVWMPILHEAQMFKSFVEKASTGQKFIAHCDTGERKKLADLIDTNYDSQLIMIGPEGDFTDEEIKFALGHQFVPVELGENRLRSETAAVAAAAVLKLL